MHALGMAAIGGLAGIVILKLLAALVLPLFGLVFGTIGFVMKIGLWIAIGYLVYTFLRGRKKAHHEG